MADRAAILPGPLLFANLRGGKKKENIDLGKKMALKALKVCGLHFLPGLLPHWHRQLHSQHE